MPSPTDLSAALSTHLATTYSLHPTPAWLHAFLTTQRPTTPLPAIQKTALFRLLASDITTSLSPTQLLPTNVVDPRTKELALPGPVVLQLRDIEDMSRSRWSQVEDIEALERGEGTRGREIVRVVPADGEQGDPPAAPSSMGSTPSTTPGAGPRSAASAATDHGAGPHKLLLEDSVGTRVYALDLEGVSRLRMLGIGGKVVVRDAVVARGVVLLSKSGTNVLGGRVEEWQKEWMQGRKERLKASITQVQPAAD